MKHTAYFHFEECPLTDIDLAICRGLADRLGGYYYGIDQTQQGVSDRLDQIRMKSLTSGLNDWRRYSWNGQLIPKGVSHTTGDEIYAGNSIEPR